MIDLSVDKSGKNGTLTLSKDLTIQHAQDFKKAMLAGINTKNLTVNLEQLERVDLATLQILCAAHRDMLKKGGSLVTVGTVPAAFRQTVLAAGFVGCAGKNDKSGLWIGEND